MKYILLLSLFILNSAFAQYAKSDKELVHITYERNFDKGVVLQYLNSKDIKKVNAALLSIGNSTDTSFISDVIKIDFIKHAEFICFALGQLGRSDNSEAFLLRELKINPSLSRYILPALGKVSKELHSDSFKEGSALSLYNSFLRNIGTQKDIADLLLKEIQKNNDFYSAFALYRVGPPENSQEVVEAALRKTLDEKDKRAIPYLLGSLRKLKVFPNDQELYTKILSLKDFQSCIEAVKAFAFYNHDNKSLHDYFKFFSDNNGNITRQAAISISDIKGHEGVLKSFIQNMILQSSSDEVTRNELLLSYAKITRMPFADLYNKFQGHVSDAGFIQTALLTGDKDAGNYIEDIYQKADYRNKVLILSYGQDSTYISSVIEKLKTSDPKLSETLNDSIKLPTGSFEDIWSNAFKYKEALITTSKGKIKIKFLPQYAPISVGNFCHLASKGYFNNNIFHRVVPGFVIQTGDTTGTGWSGPGYSIRSEFSPLEYNTGTLGMASSGRDTEGSQWFITTGNYPHLNERYSIFGVVTEGQNIADATLQEDKVISVKLIP